MNTDHLAPIHPGEILAADFLEPIGMTQYRLAKKSTFTHAASTRSCTGSGELRPTPHCGLHGYSGQVPSFGSTFKTNTNLTPSKTG